MDIPLILLLAFIVCAESAIVVLRAAAVVSVNMIARCVNKSCVRLRILSLDRYLIDNGQYGFA